MEIIIVGYSYCRDAKTLVIAKDSDTKKRGLDYIFFAKNEF
jgi:hypothetical protein